METGRLASKALQPVFSQFFSRSLLSEAMVPMMGTRPVSWAYFFQHCQRQIFSTDLDFVHRHNGRGGRAAVRRLVGQDRRMSVRDLANLLPAVQVQKLPLHVRQE